MAAYYDYNTSFDGQLDTEPAEHVDVHGSSRKHRKKSKKQKHKAASPYYPDQALPEPIEEGGFGALVDSELAGYDDTYHDASMSNIYDPSGEVGLANPTQYTELDGPPDPEVPLTAQGNPEDPPVDVTQDLSQVQISDQYDDVSYPAFQDPQYDTSYPSFQDPQYAQYAMHEDVPLPCPSPVAKPDTLSQATDLYQVVTSDGFWETGRIFAIPDHTTFTGTNETDKGWHGVWFFVVTGMHSRGVVTCQPITTYSGKGFGAKGVDPATHVPVYCRRRSPAEPRTPLACPLPPLNYRTDSVGLLPKNALVLLSHICSLNTRVARVMDVGILDNKSDRALNRYMERVSNEGDINVWEIEDVVSDLSPEVVPQGIREVAEGTAWGGFLVLAAGVAFLGMTTARMDRNRNFV
ncbi:hypothetical protein B0T16DRAFT_402578 [Cercophora newfieldiana]|uniref:DUF6590 domain-containing protein n=1 Tax=Cercophora newfieldiana TaxID=92897 RepID=A0AA39YSH6_9PEZI|nr:hypothetical protein B0T16DRAFT_402578 [Cercophora newfieldiana]